MEKISAKHLVNWCLSNLPTPTNVFCEPISQYDGDSTYDIPIWGEIFNVLDNKFLVNGHLILGDLAISLTNEDSIFDGKRVNGYVIYCHAIKIEEQKKSYKLIIVDMQRGDSIEQFKIVIGESLEEFKIIETMVLLQS